MFMRPTRRARTIRAVASTTLALFATATAAFASASDGARERPMIAAVSDTALPGEGRPPLPGPNIPDGPT
jgi:hypothetical protein